MQLCLNASETEKVVVVHVWWYSSISSSNLQHHLDVVAVALRLLRALEA